MFFAGKHLFQSCSNFRTQMRRTRKVIKTTITNVLMATILIVWDIHWTIYKTPHSMIDDSLFNTFWWFILENVENFQLSRQCVVISTFHQTDRVLGKQTALVWKVVCLLQRKTIWKFCGFLLRWKFCFVILIFIKFQVNT